MIRLFCHRFGIIFRCQIFKKKGLAFSIVLGYRPSQFKSMGPACGLLASLGTRAHVFPREQPRGHSLAPGLWLRASAGPTPPPRTSAPAPRTLCQRLRRPLRLASCPVRLRINEPTCRHPSRSPPRYHPLCSEIAAPPVVQPTAALPPWAAHVVCLAHMGLLAHAPLVCHMAHQFF